MLVTGGIAAQLAGIFAMRFAQTRKAGTLLALGLGLLALSSWLMALSLGWEVGVTWALTIISLVAYALILYPALSVSHVGHDRAPRAARQSPAAPSGSKARLTLRLLSAGPLWLIASIGLSLLIATKPWATEMTRLYVGGLSTPLFWSIGALQATVDPSLPRIVWVPLAISAVSFGLFYLI